MNQIIDQDKYHEFRYILSGCRTIYDAIYFAELYSNQYSETKELVTNIVHGKRYEKILSFKNIKMLIEKINELKYREDAEEIIKYNTSDNSDQIQLTTLMRLARNKPSRPAPVKTNQIEKRCPHCSRVNLYDPEKTYIICGYVDDRIGYDWNGCGKDWCFKCNKMLCKVWDKNSLFILSNRYHNSECCKRHAKETNRNYLEEYCQCNNINVNREVLKLSYVNDIIPAELTELEPIDSNKFEKLNIERIVDNK